MFRSSPDQVNFGTHLFALNRNTFHRALCTIFKTTLSYIHKLYLNYNGICLTSMLLSFEVTDTILLKYFNILKEYARSLYWLLHLALHDIPATGFQSIWVMISYILIYWLKPCPSLKGCFFIHHTVACGL